MDEDFNEQENAPRERLRRNANPGINGAPPAGPIHWCELRKLIFQTKQNRATAATVTWSTCIPMSKR